MKSFSPNLKIFIFLLLILDILSLQGQAVDYKGFPEWSWHQWDSTQYYLYTPSDLEPGKKYPLAIFLHGCCGQDYTATLRNTVDPPARMWHNFGENTQEIPTYIIAPKTSRGWNQHIDNLKAVIDDLIEQQQVDPQRLYITGFSMGGAGTISFLQKYPEYFAAALPMGMGFRGDISKLTDTPIWTNRGEMDHYAKPLPDSIKKIWALNGFQSDTAANWITGVNPRMTTFFGVGHGVQWHAASTQDLTDWAYSKVNDGNKYPRVYFKSPSHSTVFREGEEVSIEVHAEDKDGSIAEVQFFVNEQLLNKKTIGPFTTSLTASRGDQKITAIAIDNLGKRAEAQSIVSVDIDPEITTSSIPYGRKDTYYQCYISCFGNGQCTFEGIDLPPGLKITKEGLLHGVPRETGQQIVSIKVTDTDGDIATTHIPLEVKSARNNTLEITEVQNYQGLEIPITKFRKGIAPNASKKGNDTSIQPEVHFNELAGLGGMTMIQPFSEDADTHIVNHLTFTIDQDAEVMIAFEKKDRLFNSSIPQWLKSFKKNIGKEIVAQYRYFDLFSKVYSAGTITLPGADAKNHNVNTNYFVLIKPLTDVDLRPEININHLPEAKAGYPYSAQLTHLYGTGDAMWKSATELPTGLQLSCSGQLKGVPTEAGVYHLKFLIQNDTGILGEETISLHIER